MSGTLAAIERRLARIETARRRPRGLFFVAWGRTPAEIEAAVARAREAGALAPGDPVVRCAWPAAAASPASRWVQDEQRAFDRREFGALMDEVDRLMDEWRTQIRAEMDRRGELVPVLPPGEPPAAERDAKARTKHDAALIAVILAVPLDGGRTLLTEDRMWRVIRSMEEAGLRDRIRGRNGVAVATGAAADRPTQH